MTLIILSMDQPQLCSQVVTGVSHGKPDEIIQPPQLWTSKMSLYSIFFWLFPPSQGKLIIVLPLVERSTDSDGYG